MTEISRAWQGVSPGDAGPYSSDQWAELWRNSMPGGFAVDNGPIIGTGVAPDFGLSVTENTIPSMGVILTSGSALVHGTHYTNDANLLLAVGANVSGNPRIDTVVLRKDWTAQTIRAFIKQGTPAATPTAPGMTQSNGVLWEVPVADIAVANGFTSVINADITPRRHYANAADGVYLLNVLNNSGVTLKTGAPVVSDTTVNNAVTISTTFGALVVGVWVGSTPNGGYGRMLVRGIGYVRTNSAATNGDTLVHSTTAQQADNISSTALDSSNARAFARALETTSGAGLVLARIDAGLNRYPATAQLLYTAANKTTVSATFVAMDAANVLITALITTGRALVTFSATVKDTTGTVNNEGYFAMDVDGTLYKGGGATFLPTALTFPDQLIHYTVLVTGLSAGVHTFTPFWRCAIADGLTAVVAADTPIHVIVLEV